LKEFPDYLDYMPEGCIARKVKVMGIVPPLDESITQPVSISRDELTRFVENAARTVMQKLSEKLTDF